MCERILSVWAVEVELVFMGQAGLVVCFVEERSCLDSEADEFVVEFYGLLQELVAIAGCDEGLAGNLLTYF